MRLFVALDVDEAVRRRATALIDTVSARFGPDAVRIAWVPPDRMHLTLLFIGHVDATTATDIQNRLAPAYPVESFSVRFGGLGFFPPTGRPRVVWAGIERGREDVHRLHVETVRRLDDVSFRREARPFSAHLTLGRFREPGPTRLRRELQAMAPPEIGRCTIESVTLYESRLSSRGPTYVPVLRSPLRREA